MWSWLSVALSGYISISAHENNKLAQALIFKVLSLALLVIIILTSMTAFSYSAVWIIAGLVVSMIADYLHGFVA